MRKWWTLTTGKRTDALPEHRTRVGVECPLCHWQHALEVETDLAPEKFMPLPEVRAGLEAWLASHCPYHLGVLLGVSKN